MSAEQMDDLLSRVGADLRRLDTNYREAIEPKQRLAVALRYLATGESFVSLASSYRLGHSTVSVCVHRVCAAIEKHMMSACIPVPTEEAWKAVAQRLWEKWNFPNCLGALGGRHVNIKVPPRSGSQYFDCKGTFSIVLMALVDADYRFRVIQVGDFGGAGDRGVYSSSDLGHGMASKTLNVPPSAPIPGAAQLGDVPFVMVGDAAFPLKPYLMRPYPTHNLPKEKKVFNRRLSRANAVAQKAFSILASRWRVLHTKINLHPAHVDTVVIAACILHNFLLSPHESRRLLDEERRTGQSMRTVTRMGGNRGSREAFDVRELLRGFFNSPEGSVSWQRRVV